MKKRIISVLLFLVVVMCLTACSETPSEAVIYDDVSTIAREVKNNPDYQLTEGYTLRYADENNRIAIIIKDLGIGAYYKAEFDMTQEIPKLLKIEKTYTVGYVFMEVIIILLSAFLLFILLEIFS